MRVPGRQFNVEIAGIETNFKGESISKRRRRERVDAEFCASRKVSVVGETWGQGRWACYCAFKNVNAL